MEEYNDDDKDSSTPLDLLLNAITDRRDYDPSSLVNGFGALGEGEGTLEGGEMMDLSGLLKQSGYDLSSLGASGTRDAAGHSAGNADKLSDVQLVRSISRLVLGMTDDRSGAEGGGSSTMSTIQVWHPTAAQKSYGKERRLLAPPPFVRASGPIANHITSIALSAMPSATNFVSSSSQTHHLGSGPSQPDSTSSPAALPAGIPPFQDKKSRSQESRRLFKEAALRSGFGATLPTERTRGGAKDRGMLRDGVSFPGLWIGQEGGKKEKEFRLILDVRTNEELSQGTGSEQSLGFANQVKTAGTASTAMNEAVLHDHSAELANTIPHAPADIINAPIPPPWATLTSSPLSIVSKPSIKTAKSRSVSSCLSETASFALWVRINAQTVRTKYMKLDESPDGSARLTSKTGKWTPFRFDIIRRAELIDPTSSARLQSGGVMTYGSIVRLEDLQSGSKSEPVKIVKVEKNESLIAGEEGQPLSELQRIGLVRVDETGAELLDEGRRVYLSAPGARIGGGELRDPSEQRLVWIGRNRKVPKSTSGVPLPQDIATDQEPIPGPSSMPGTLEEAGLAILDETELDDAFGLTNPDIALPAADNQAEATEERPKKRLKTKRNALAAAVLQEDDPGADQTVCTWAAAERREVEREEKMGKEVVGRRVEVDVVDDWMSWVIAGVDNFTHSFSTISADTLPNSISPSPRLLLDPLFHPSQNTLQLTLSSFFTQRSSTSRPSPLQVYLGPIGPLTVSTFRSVCSKDTAKDGAVPVMAFDGEVTSVQSGDTGLEQIYSSFPASIPHVIVLVKMPNPAETLRTMQLLQVQAGITKDATAGQAARESLARSLHPEGLDERVDSPDRQRDMAGSTDNHTTWIDTLGDLGADDDDNNEAIRQALESVSKVDVDDGLYGDAATPSIDPTPHLPGGGHTRPVSMSAGHVVSLSSINLIRPETSRQSNQATRVAETNASGMVSLPILLVNRDDGVVFGLSRSVVAERRRDDGDSWGLRVVTSG